MKMILLIFSCVFMLTACDNTARFLDCIDGCSLQQGPVGPQGPEGPQGLPGINGTDGTSGLSCTVSPLVNGAYISCEDGTFATILNGTNGSNGADGSIIEQIELCPLLEGGKFHEYLLKIDGSFFGVYAHGSKTGLSKLWPGNWVTTDGRNCEFTIHPDGTVTF